MKVAEFISKYSEHLMFTSLLTMLLYVTFIRDSSDSVQDLVI